MHFVWSIQAQKVAESQLKTRNETQGESMSLKGEHNALSTAHTHACTVVPKARVLNNLLQHGDFY